MRIKTIGAIIALFLLFSLSNVVSAQLVNVEINNSTDHEVLTLLDPNDGNWIKMVGGESKIELLDIKFVYNGTDSANYTTDGKKVNITTNGIDENQPYVVDYPFDGNDKLPIYYEDNPVKAKIHTNNGLDEEEAYLYLINTYPTELKDVFTSAVDGNTQPLRNMLNNAIEEESITINQNNLNNLNFGELSPGDYVIVATLNSSSRQNIIFLSATCFEVLEHKSAIKNLKKHSNSFKRLSGNFTVQGGSDQAKYTYIAALMKEDTPINFTLESRGTKESTNIYANDAELVDSWSISGSDSNNINASTVFEWFNGTFPPNSVSISIEKYPKTGNSHDFRIPIEGLKQGIYQLNVGAWNATNSSQRLVAFSQKTVSFFNSESDSDTDSNSGNFLARYEPPDIIYTEVEENKPSKFKVENFTPQKPLRFEVENSAFTSISITAKNKVNEFEVDITKNGGSSNLGNLDITAGGNVYEYMNIEVNQEDDIENTTIRFKVNKSWLKQQDVSKEDVFLQKFHDGWTQIPIRVMGETQDEVLYEANFSGFSLFVITTTTDMISEVTELDYTQGGKIVDSDGDGYSDGYENKHGTDLDDPDDYPGKPSQATTTAAVQPSPTVTATSTATTKPSSSSPTPSSALTGTPAETPPAETGPSAWQPMEIVVIAAVLIGSAAVIIYIVRR